MAILALEHALRKNDAIIKLVTDTKVHIHSVFEKIFTELLNDCPQSIRPDFKAKYHTYYFSNGSQIQLAGTDNKHYDRLRGQKATLVLIDEAGFCTDLRYIVEQIFIPTTIHTGGKIVLASTPPADLDHDFFKFIEEAETRNKLTRKTVYDNPLLKEEQIERLKESMGGENSDSWKREFLCQVIKDPTLSVVPEFDAVLEKEIVKEWPKPPFYDAYEAMDTGGRDLTVVVFGYFDFRANKIIIEDELIMNFNNPNESLVKLVERIDTKEKELWTNPLSLEVKTPYLRFSDVDYITIREILVNSGNRINFIPTKKDEKETAVNNLRTLLAAKKIIIHPRCVTLIRHLKNAKWDSRNARNRFARSPDDAHYDAVDALIYLVRNVIFGKNPYPANYDINPSSLTMIDQMKYYNTQNQDPADVYKKIFNVKSKPKRIL
jgi:hypothetical protein